VFARPRILSPLAHGFCLRSRTDSVSARARILCPLGHRFEGARGEVFGRGEQRQGDHPSSMIALTSSRFANSVVQDTSGESRTGAREPTGNYRTRNTAWIGAGNERTALTWRPGGSRLWS